MSGKPSAEASPARTAEVGDKETERRLTMVNRGYLFKRTETRPLNTWHRRFWVLASDGALREYRDMRSYGNGVRPMRTIFLSSAVKAYRRDGRRFRITFFSEGRRFILRCDSETRFNRWRRAFSSIEEEPPATPSAATESDIDRREEGMEGNSFVGRVMNEIGGGTSTVMRALDDTSKALVSPFVGAGALASGTETPPDAFERSPEIPRARSPQAPARSEASAAASGISSDLQLELSFAGGDSMDCYDDIVPSPRTVGCYRFESDFVVVGPVASLVLYDRDFETNRLKDTTLDGSANSRSRQVFPLGACANESDAWALEHISRVYISPMPISEIVHLTICLAEGSPGDLKHFEVPDFEIGQRQLDWGVRPRLFFTPKNAIKRPLLQAALSMGFGSRGEGWSSELDSHGHEIWVIQRPPYMAVNESGQLLATFILRNPGNFQLSSLLAWCTKFRIELPTRGGGATGSAPASIKFEVAGKRLMRHIG